MASEIKVGAKALFKGYLQLEDGAEALLMDDQLVEITSIESNRQHRRGGDQR